MSPVRSWLVAISASLPLLACGAAPPDAPASAPYTPAPSAVVEAPDAPTERAAPAPDRLRARLEGDPNGCPLLSVAELRDRFPNAPADVDPRLTTSPYLSCTFSWDAATPAQRRIGGRVVETPGLGRVTVTRAEVRSADADWQRVLSSFRNEPVENISNLGDRAVWSEQRSQVSVLSPRWVLHVAVEDSDAPGTVRDRAIALALDLLSASP